MNLELILQRNINPKRALAIGKDKMIILEQIYQLITVRYKDEASKNNLGC